VNELSRGVVDEQRLGDAVDRTSLGASAAATADHRAAARLRRRRAHRVVVVRPGRDLAERRPLQLGRQFVEPVHSADVEAPGRAVQRHVRHVVRHAVEQADAQLLQRRAGTSCWNHVDDARRRCTADQQRQHRHQTARQRRTPDRRRTTDSFHLDRPITRHHQTRREFIVQLGLSVYNTQTRPRRI